MENNNNENSVENISNFLNQKTNNGIPKPVKMIIYIICVLLLLCGSIMFILSSINKVSIRNISVNSKSDINYSVNLKENEYYEKDVLPEDMEYIASLIKSIDTNFKYSIESKDALDFESTYYADATINVYGNNSNKNIIYTKTIKLTDVDTKKILNSNNLELGSELNIDYNEYNKLIASFKTSYLLSSTADVTISLHVTTKIKSDAIEQEKTIVDASELVIPLTQQTINVKINKKPAKSYSVINSTPVNKIDNVANFVIGIVLFVIAAGLGVKIYFTGLDRIDNPVRPYKKKLKKILKEYDLIIVNTKNDINEKDYDVVNVTTFDELKDVHDNIGNPIMFREVKKNNVSIFTIANENILYKYVLKAQDLMQK